MGRGQRGKAMFIAIDKLTAVRMYEKVRAYWQREIGHLQDELATATPRAGSGSGWPRRSPTWRRPTWRWSSPRRRTSWSCSPRRGSTSSRTGCGWSKEDLEKKFKDPDDPFRLVFVCAMWITGFDVPCCNTIYLDKPMRNHTLMQTIARANRVFRDKLNGLIVDYVGVFRNMQKALAIYGSGSGGGAKEGECPVKVKAFLVEKLREKIAETEAFLQRVGEPLNAIQAADEFEFIATPRRGRSRRSWSARNRRSVYMSLANWVARIYKAILPDPGRQRVRPEAGGDRQYRRGDPIPGAGGRHLRHHGAGRGAAG